MRKMTDYIGATWGILLFTSTFECVRRMKRKLREEHRRQDPEENPVSESTSIIMKTGAQKVVVRDRRTSKGTGGEDVGIAEIKRRVGRTV